MPLTHLNSKKQAWLVGALLVLANLLVKGFYLGSNALGGDEPFSVYHAQMDAFSIVRLLSMGNNPPLYELLLHVWIGLGGISEWWVRLPSLLFSSVTVLFIYKIGAKFLNKRVGLYAGILFICSNYHVLFAHEARVYALLGMLAVVSMYCFLELTQALPEQGLLLGWKSWPANLKRSGICLIFVNVLLIYAHYFGFFILFVQATYLLFQRSLLLAYWKQWLAGVALLLLFYLPNVWVLVQRFLQTSSQGTWVKPPDGVDTLYNMFWQFSNAPVVTVLVLLVLVSALVKYVLVRKRLKTTTAQGLVVFWFVGIFFVMFGISYAVPMFLDRYLMPAALAFGLVLAMASDFLIQRSNWRYAIPVMICLLFAFSLKPNISNKREVAKAVNQVKALQKPGSVVIFCPKDFMLTYAYHYDRRLFESYNTVDILANIDSGLQAQNVYGVDHLQDFDLAAVSHLIFLDAAGDISGPYSQIPQILAQNFSLEQEFFVYEIFKIKEYVPPMEAVR